MKKYAYTIKYETEALRQLLATDARWAKRALVRIYEAQTADEQAHGATCHYNGIGFTGTDARCLTKIVKWYLSKGYIGKFYMDILHQRIQKYAGQIFSLPDFDHEKFDRILAGR